MPMYRVVINNEDMSDYITATSLEDAYADVATTLPLRYDDSVQITEVESPLAKPGLPVGNNTIQTSGKVGHEPELRY